MLRWYYSVDGSTTLEITGRVNWPDIEVGSKANQDGWEGDLLVNDPAGDLIMLMFRRIWAIQDAAPTGHTLVGNWFISNLRIKRGNPKVLASRVWVVTMVDENVLLDRAIFIGSDSNRPAETDIERLRWFLTTTEGSFFDPDETYIDTTGPVNLDAVDLRQQSSGDMMASLMAASGKHYWVMYREDLNAYGIWYANMNTSALYVSTVSLSNVLSEVNLSTVYPLSGDAELDRAGGRMAYQLVVPYKAGWVVVADATFLVTYGHVDRTAPAPNVSSLAKATAQATRQLRELQIPDDEVTTTLTVEEANLNLVMHGMIVPVHASHFPNYTATDARPGWAADYVNCRVMERTVRQVGPTTFEIPLRLSPVSVAIDSWCVITWPYTEGDVAGGRIPFHHSGDNPHAGDGAPSSTPSYGLLSKIGTLAGGDGSSFTGILCEGSGTVDVYWHTDFNWTTGNAGNACTWAIYLNGVQVAGTHVDDPGSGAHAWVPLGIDATISDLAVVAGDVIEAYMLYTGPDAPPTSFFAMPAGSGSGMNHLSVSGMLA